VPPIGKVGIDRKAIAVTEEKSRPVGATMTAHQDFGAVVEAYVKSLARARHNKSHERSFTAWQVGGL